MSTTASNNGTTNNYDSQVREHVLSQITFLKECNYEAAFAMNSQPNQERIGNSTTFMNIIRNNQSFKLLADDRSLIKLDGINDNGNIEAQNSYTRVELKLYAYSFSSAHV